MICSTIWEKSSRSQFRILGDPRHFYPTPRGSCPRIRTSNHLNSIVVKTKRIGVVVWLLTKSLWHLSVTMDTYFGPCKSSQYLTTLWWPVLLFFRILRTLISFSIWAIEKFSPLGLIMILIASLPTPFLLQKLYLSISMQITPTWDQSTCVQRNVFLLQFSYLAHTSRYDAHFHRVKGWEAPKDVWIQNSFVDVTWKEAERKLFPPLLHLKMWPVKKQFLIARNTIGLRLYAIPRPFMP